LKICLNTFISLVPGRISSLVEQQLILPSIFRQGKPCTPSSKLGLPNPNLSFNVRTSSHLTGLLDISYSILGFFELPVIMHLQKKWAQLFLSIAWIGSRSCLNGLECISSPDFSLFFANIMQQITMDIPRNTIDFLLFLVLQTSFCAIKAVLEE